MLKYIKPTNPKKARNSQPLKETKKSDSTSNKQINENKQHAKKKIYKSQKVTPIKDNSVKDLYILKNDTPKQKKHPEYGTSKLETKFANNFLKKLNVEFQTQFKAESIGRYYDFYIPSANLIIEIDGDYYHSFNVLYENMSPMQKKNKRVDKDKDKWAKEHKKYKKNSKEQTVTVPKQKIPKEEIIPDWFNKNIEKQTATSEQKQEMQDLLKDFQ